MSINKLTAPESSHYLEFSLTKSLNRLLLGVFTFLISKKYDMKTIDTYKPTAISIYNYLPLDAVYRHTCGVYNSLGRTFPGQTRSGRRIICVNLYQFNCLSSNNIPSILMHELTHVRQYRNHSVESTSIKTVSRYGYDSYKNSPREKEAVLAELEFTEWCQRERFTVGYLGVAQKLLSTFPQGHFVFKVETKGVKMIGFVPRDLSDYKEIL